MIKKEHQLASLDKVRQYKRISNLRIKKEVLTHYGGNALACVHCGFSDIRALQLDHINDDGALERRHTDWRRGGLRLYYKLKREGYPSGYQTLCANCQWIKEYNRRRCCGRSNTGIKQLPL